MASGETPIYLLKYPVAGDPVNVHGDMELLAEQVEDVFETKADLYENNEFEGTNHFVANSANPAVQITQEGAGPSFKVMDDSPDTTFFIIDSDGRVGIGTNSDNAFKVLIENDDIDDAVLGIRAIENQVGNLTSWYIFDEVDPVVTIDELGNFTAITLTSGPGGVSINGATSGLTTIEASDVASGILTLPAATDTLVGKATTDIFTNKTFDTDGDGNLFYINANLIDDYTGTGSIAVLSTSPNISTSLTTDSVTFDLLDSVATTINFGGAATVIDIGSDTGTTTVKNNLVVDGDLTVHGTATVLNTEQMTIEDNIIVLNSNVTGSPTLDAGIEVERGTSANVSLLWDETDENWVRTKDGTNFYHILTKDADDEEWLADNVIAPLFDHDNHIGVVVTYDDATNEIILESAGGGGGTGSASLSDIWWLGA
jgi:hypothetical protein